MELVTIIGFKQMNFTAQDGNNINGYRFYYVSNADPNTHGQTAGNFFLSADKCRDYGILEHLAKLPFDCTILYNRYGKVGGLQF